MQESLLVQVLNLSKENVQMRELIADALYLAEDKGWNDVVAKLRQALNVGQDVEFRDE